MKSKKYYISGPMTGYEKFNFQKFFEVELDLRNKGVDAKNIVNPARLSIEFADKQNKYLTEIEYKEYMKNDIIALLDCTDIVLLPGYENSKGGMLEFHIARTLDMDVVTDYL